MDAIDALVARSQDCKELRRFHEFHRNHPEVLAFLVEEIRLRLDQGFTSFSHHRLWEYARWKLEMETGPKHAFVMDDRCAPLYARAIAILHPEFDNAAKLGKSRTDAALVTQIAPLARQPSEELCVPGLWYSFAGWLEAHEAAHAVPRPCNPPVDRNVPSLSPARA